MIVLTKEESLWPRKRGNKFTDQVFWKDEHVGQVWTCKPEDAKQVAATREVIHYRSFDLNKFLTKLESDDNEYEVIGLKFEDNNLTVILK
jgi:hypothetical protein